MLREKLKAYKIILASGSKRRQQLFEELHLDFSIDVRNIDETFPNHLKGSEITDYLSQKKAAAFTDISDFELIITSDTIVWKNEKAVGKPENFEEAKQILQSLSGGEHEVITSVCFTSKNLQKTVNNTTKVWFKNLTEEEIDFYLQNYKPFDKAGSYGIQEWIGYIGIEKIEGSYYNVMGLPIHMVYKTLLEIGKGNSL